MSAPPACARVPVGPGYAPRDAPGSPLHRVCSDHLGSLLDCYLVEPRGEQLQGVVHIPAALAALQRGSV